MLLYTDLSGLGTLADICGRLVNLVSDGPGVRYKQSSMPFVQMENISHFLRVCQSPPLNLQPHDLFQTVDLYEAKDPAQVLQCIGAFSRRAHVVQPTIFKRAIGGKNKGVMSPQSTGGNNPGGGGFSRAGGFSDTDNTLSALPNPGAPRNASPALRTEPSKSTPVNGGLASSSSPGVSSWSKRTDEAATTPAWNIHQYGYMGGASQGNQGISFGGRRQITTPAPQVPSLAEKERRRREADAETERLRVQAEEAERKRLVEIEAEEKRSQEAEERRRQEAMLREKQDEALADDERRQREEAETSRESHKDSQRIRAEKSSASMDGNIAVKSRKETEQRSGGRDARLRGQFLSQYQAEQRKLPPIPGSQGLPPTAERRRIQELEQELERARQNEEAKQRASATEFDGPRQHFSHSDYQASSGLGTEEPGSLRQDSHEPFNSQPRPLPSLPPASRKDSREDGHEDGDAPWDATERDYLRHEWAAHQRKAQPAFDVDSHSSQPQFKPSRPLPTPQTLAPSLPVRPLPIPQESPPRAIPQFSSKPSSLLAREMERDRIRQQEWEEAQQATSLAAAKRLKDGERGGVAGIDSGDAGWDVNQYGYLGGDNQNRGGPGLGFGARRQIIGPRVEVRKG